MKKSDEQTGQTQVDKYVPHKLVKPGKPHANLGQDISQSLMPRKRRERNGLIIRKQVYFLTSYCMKNALYLVQGWHEVYLV